MSTTKNYYDAQLSKPSDGRYQASTFPCYRASISSFQHSGKSMQTLSLISFVKKYSSSLPVRVCVVEGYSGKNDRSEISSGDIFDFHFLKTELVMSLRDEIGKTHHIPLSSPVKFGLFYNPCNNSQRAKMGYVFTTVSDLVDYNKPPHIIRATTKFLGNGRCNSVFANELLIVKTVGLGETRKDHYINVFSLLSKREKTLYGDCSGNFTTEPTGVALSSSDTLQFFSHILPHRAMMVINGDVTDESVLHLGSEVITLYGTTTEHSVIATTVETHDNSTKNVETSMTVSIPNDLKIKVSAVENQPDEVIFFQRTRDLFESFDLSKVKDIRRSTCSSTHSVQLHFYEEIGLRQRSQSIELKKPERVYARLTKSSKASSLPSQYTVPISSKNMCPANSLSTGTKKEMDHSSQLSPHHELQGLHATNITSDPQSPAPQIETRNTQLLIPNVEHSYSYMEQRNKGRLPPPRSATVKRSTSLVQEMHFNQRKYDIGRKSQQSLLKRSESYTIADERDVKRRNVVELQWLNHNQVLDLLKRMGLSHHRKRFTEEHIDGEILSECDCEVLQFELGITNKDEQARLMNIILGVDSVKIYT